MSSSKNLISNYITNKSNVVFFVCVCVQLLAGILVERVTPAKHS